MRSRSNHITILLILLQFFAVYITSAQNPIFTKIELLEGVVAWNMTTRMVQDQQRYIWICTRFGFLRYDGIDYISCNHNPELPQDISSVIPKQINNAFYAVDKKAKEGNPEYKPEVIVSTKNPASPAGRLQNSIEILVKDNGEGIPEKVQDKIFQLFSSTKPTGSGTGLGLSLSYDIVKAHGGELKLESEVGNGSQFMVIIPIQI